MQKTIDNISISPPPKIAAVHDISCIGRCACTVIIPVLSALGVQVCPLPTALLSTHTGGYEGFTFMDLSDEMKKISAHWDSIDTVFDAVYSGFLGSANQIETVREFVNNCKAKKPECIFLADPVMGDDGEKYATYTDEMCRLTKKLVSGAHVITPNVTEACILLDEPYRKDFSSDKLCEMGKELCAIGAENVIITGIHRGDEVGAVYYISGAGASGTDKFGEYFTKRDPNNYPGAGDIFSSMILAGVLKGMPLAKTVKNACDFIYSASGYTTLLGTPIREGLAIEPLMGQLIDCMK